MCSICDNLIKNKISVKDAIFDLRESLVDIPSDHIIKVLDLIDYKELEIEFNKRLEKYSELNNQE